MVGLCYYRKRFLCFADGKGGALFCFPQFAACIHGEAKYEKEEP